MSTTGHRRTHLRLMNEYDCDPPLWSDGGHVDGAGLGLSADLLVDLSDFARRWDAAVPDGTFDDRWDGVAVVRQVVAARYALRRWRPGARRRARAEDAALRATGESLRRRLQEELGDRFVVTYQH